MSELKAPKTFVIMGVCGSGKSTIGEALGRAMDWRYFDADSFHSQASKDKMASGVPLSDQDRLPWLKAIGKAIASNSNSVQIISCSALKKEYRDLLREYGAVEFIYLKGSKELIAKRLEDRTGHFMNPELLASQFETLEEPKNGLHVEIDSSVDAIVSNIISYLGPCTI